MAITNKWGENLPKTAIDFHNKIRQNIRAIYLHGLRVLAFGLRHSNAPPAWKTHTLDSLPIAGKSIALRTIGVRLGQFECFTLKRSHWNRITMHVWAHRQLGDHRPESHYKFIKQQKLGKFISICWKEMKLRGLLAANLFGLRTLKVWKMLNNVQSTVALEASLQFRCTNR